MIEEDILRVMAGFRLERVLDFVSGGSASRYSAGAEHQRRYDTRRHHRAHTRQQQGRSRCAQ
jgi:hypothetical protein